LINLFVDRFHPDYLELFYLRQSPFFPYVSSSIVPKKISEMKKIKVIPGKEFTDTEFSTCDIAYICLFDKFEFF
jgi:hypothetical protein